MNHSILICWQFSRVNAHPSKLNIFEKGRNGHNQVGFRGTESLRLHVKYESVHCPRSGWPRARPLPEISRIPKTLMKTGFIRGEQAVCTENKQEVNFEWAVSGPQPDNGRINHACARCIDLCCIEREEVYRTHCESGVCYTNWNDCRPLKRQNRLLTMGGHAVDPQRANSEPRAHHGWTRQHWTTCRHAVNP